MVTHVGIGVFLGVSHTPITRGRAPRSQIEIACINPHQTGFVGTGSDHLQVVKFWPSRAPGKGSAAGRNFLAPPYYSQRAVSLTAVFIPPD